MEALDMGETRRVGWHVDIEDLVRGGQEVLDGDVVVAIIEGVRVLRGFVGSEAQIRQALSDSCNIMLSV